MGRDIEVTEFTREDRTRFREKVRGISSPCAQLVDGGRFETGRRQCGVEMEVHLTDQLGNAAPINAKLLENLASSGFQTELAQFNIEFGVSPRVLTGHVFHTIDSELRRSLNHAYDVAEQLGARG